MPKPNSDKPVFETTLKVLGEGCPSLTCIERTHLTSYDVIEMGSGKTTVACAVCGQRYVMPW